MGTHLLWHNTASDMPDEERKVVWTGPNGEGVDGFYSKRYGFVLPGGEQIKYKPSQWRYDDVKE